jgi:asparagine synthase (glutamine-hydrolysing)
VPYLDHRLVSFAMSLPAGLKIQGMKRKVFFKEAVKGLVPDKIINRPKRGFELPLRDWFRGPLRPMVEGVLAEDKIESAGVLSPKAVRLMVHRHMEGFDDLSLQIWSFMVLQKWLEKYGRE